MSKKSKETSKKKDFFKDIAVQTLPGIASVDRSGSVNKNLAKETASNKLGCTDCGSQCLSGCKDECITVSD